MNKKIVVFGVQNSGKTFVASLLKKIIEQETKHKVGYFKPFETSSLLRNAKEELSDAEFFVDKFNLEEGVNLITPYIANEDYSFEFSSLRDGIKLNHEKLSHRIQIIEKAYSLVLIESPQGGLFDPIENERSFYDLMDSKENIYIWTVNPLKENFNRCYEIYRLLKSMGIKTLILINNQTNSPDGSLLKYYWEKLSQEKDQFVLGMIPFIKDLDSEESFIMNFSESIPLLNEELIQVL